MISAHSSQTDNYNGSPVYVYKSLWASAAPYHKAWLSLHDTRLTACLQAVVVLRMLLQDRIAMGDGRSVKLVLQQINGFCFALWA